MKRFFPKGVSVVLTLVAWSLVSCDKDFAELDSGLIVDDDNFDVKHEKFDAVKAFMQPTGAVQSNNLPVNPLGILENGSTFGSMKAEFVTQLSLASTSVTFDDSPVIDSVALYVPYFSSKRSTDSHNNSVYALDSIYGRGKLKLEVFESGKVINNFAPPDFTQAQAFYNDEAGLFVPLLKGAYEDGTAAAGAPALNNDPEKKWQNDEFHFRKNEIYLKSPSEEVEGEIDTTRQAPGMRLALNKNFFKKKILEAPQGVLANNALFRDYMRGLYFKVSALPGGTALGMLDFSKGSITIYYKGKKSSTDATMVRKTFTINLSGNTISFQQNAFGTAYAEALAGRNTETGDPRLYLKGGQGSIAYIDLFGQRTAEPDQLKRMKDEKWMINEASLTFTIDQASMRTTLEPYRVYLFNATDNTVIADFSTDVTTFSDPKYSKYVFGGFLTRETTDNRAGKQYTIRVTDHIRSLLKGKDDVRLGLCVIESIGAAANVKAKPTADSSIYVPFGSVMHPFGTVLWGNTPDVAQDKRIKLDIYYTKSKENQ